MAGDTLAEIRELVLDRANIGPGDPFADPARVNRVINTSLKRLGRTVDWPWLQVIGTINMPTSGVFDLSTVPGYRHTISLSIGDRELSVRVPAEMVRYSTLSADWPRVYSIVGDTLTVAPVPSSATDLDHIYLIDEPVLGGDSDRPILPTPYTELLVLFTATTLIGMKGNTARYQQLRSEYQDALKEATDEVWRTKNYPRVRADETAWAV